jgi:hypothetical protein
MQAAQARMKTDDSGKTPAIEQAKEPEQQSGKAVTDSPTH